MARTVWERTCKDRYLDLLSKARKAAFKEVNSNNYANLKGHGPRGMKREVWDGLVDIWETPKWQKKSEVGQKNRASMPDSMLHTGGSISFGEHKKKMVICVCVSFCYINMLTVHYIICIPYVITGGRVEAPCFF